MVGAAAPRHTCKLQPPNGQGGHGVASKATSKGGGMGDLSLMTL